jgi:MSHA biogenesis protein MshN
MSVINRMLAELDARRAPAPPPAAHPAAVPMVMPPRGSARRLLLGACLASVAALGNWPAWFGAPARAPQPAAMAEPAVALPVAAALAPTGAPIAASAAAPMAGLSYSLSPPRTTTPARPRRLAAAALPVPASLPTPLPPDAPAPSQVEKQAVALSAAQQAARTYREAVDLAAAGSSTQAIDKALEALRQAPRHTAARQLAAVLMFESHRLDEARTLLAEGLAHGPQDPALVLLMARLLVDSGEHAGALQWLDTLAAPGAEAQGLRAGILVQQGRVAQALPAYEAAVRLAPEHAPWWLGLGLALDAQGRAAEARLAFQRARALGSLRGDLLVYVEQKLAATR